MTLDYMEFHLLEKKNKTILKKQYLLIVNSDNCPPWAMQAERNSS